MTKDKVKVVVVTDGERVLGLGDQIGGMGIAIGKQSLYTACGGISPAYTLPVALMLAQHLQALDDPCIWVGGLRESVLLNITHLLMVSSTLAGAGPGVLVQFEDFAQPNAMPLLQAPEAGVLL